MPYIGQQSPSGNEIWNGSAWVVGQNVDVGYGAGVDRPGGSGATAQGQVAQSYNPGLYTPSDTRAAPGGSNPASQNYVPKPLQGVYPNASYPAATTPQVAIPPGSVPREIGGGVTEYTAPDGSRYRTQTDPTTGRTAVTQIGGQGSGTVPGMSLPTAGPTQPAQGGGTLGAGDPFQPMVAQPNGTAQEQPMANGPAAWGPMVPGQNGLPGNPAPQRKTPNPWQINPAVWDSLGNMGQQLALGFAEDEGWDAGDYQRQIDATRPRGQASSSTRTLYQQPQRYYG